MLTVGGLFSGIGGIELGLERAGMRVLWHCESDPYARRVLAQHWPDVPCYPDVCGLQGADLEPVDVLCGGFPCQDLSLAGNRAGIDGERSGLWAEMFRLACELRPRYLLVENVSALLVGGGFDRVLSDLASSRFDAEWSCIRASDFGAPHQRERVFLLAYPERSGRDGLHERVEPRHMEAHPSRSRPDLTDGASTNDHCRRVPGQRSQGSTPGSADHWATEPVLGRLVDGVPDGLDRLRCLGNAVVPQVSEWIGHRILDREGCVTA